MDKRTLIMQSALELFSKNGYHNTTIQDIANEAGIAKGGIYSYFESKEELLLSVVTEYYDKLFSNIAEAAGRHAAQRKEGLIQQIMIQFQDWTSYRTFQALFYHGQIEISPEIQQLSANMRAKILVWFRDQIIAVYGPKIEPHALDLSALLTSLTREYLNYILLSKVALPIRGLAEYIVARLDDAARGVLRSDEPPMLTTSFIKNLFPDVEIAEGTDAVRRLNAALDPLYQQLEYADIPEETRSNLMKAVDVLREETRTRKPRRIVMEGMTAVIRTKLSSNEYPYLDTVESIIAEFP